MHLDLDLAIPAAHFAPAALDAEREPPRLVAPGTRLGCARVQLADVVEHAGIGGRVRPRCASDRRLVDVDDLVDLVRALDLLVGAGPQLRPVQPVCDRAEEDLVHERRLAGARDARDAAEQTEGEGDVDALQVVLRGAQHIDRPARLAALCRDFDPALARKELAGE